MPPNLRRRLPPVGAATLAVVVTYVLAVSVQAQPLPPELTQPVNDFAHVIDDARAREMESLIRSLQQATGDVVVVATVDTIAPYANIDPWLGVGIGMEFLAVKAYDPSINDVSKFTWAGIEFPLLEAGLDLAVSPRATIGPYVAWSLAYYTRYGIESPGYPDLDGSIQDRALHTWFQIGVKGTLKL